MILVFIKGRVIYMTFLKLFFGSIAVFGVTIWVAFEQYVLNSEDWM